MQHHMSTVNHDNVERIKGRSDKPSGYLWSQIGVKKQ